MTGVQDQGRVRHSSLILRMQKKIWTCWIWWKTRVMWAFLADFEEDNDEQDGDEDG